MANPETVGVIKEIDVLVEAAMTAIVDGQRSQSWTYRSQKSNLAHRELARARNLLELLQRIA